MDEVDKGQREFHLEEFKQLHAEVDEALRGSREIMKWTLISSAAIFAWLTTTKPENGTIPTAAWYIPLVLTVFGTIATAMWMVRVKQTGTYLERLEHYLGKPAPDFGWETYLEPKLSILTGAGAAFWVLLFLANIAAPCLMLVPPKVQVASPICETPAKCGKANGAIAYISGPIG